MLAACGSSGDPHSGDGTKTEITIMAPLHFPNPPHDDLIRGDQPIDKRGAEDRVGAGRNLYR